MNTTGIIIAVALPAFACGVSAATWAIRSSFAECIRCGRIESSERPGYTCDECRAESSTWPMPANRLTDIHLAQ